MLLFLLLSFVFYDINGIIPRVNYGQCMVIEDELYYLNRRIDIPNIGILNEENKQVFQLDFTKGVKLVGNMAEWEAYNMTNPISIFLTFSKYFYVGNRISMAFHGYSDKETITFSYFNLKTM
ncbi:hypothetical protein K502DRAFT_325544 [Neoconidiobolus thromboides FSU 785]|nr:hypothetical protein K502DRAFT_325544 [Neoconidiobolus thromboides FSU 785]